MRLPWTGVPVVKDGAIYLGMSGEKEDEMIKRKRYPLEENTERREKEKLVD